MALLAPRFDFIERLRQAQATDPALVAIYEEIRAGTCATPWSIVGGMVAMEGRLYIPATSPLLREIVAAVHDDGHEGVHHTLHRSAISVFPTCVVLCSNSSRRAARAKNTSPITSGRLAFYSPCRRPLSIPSGVWSDICIDFIEALPRAQGKTVILTVVDRFSKYFHFIPLAHPYTAESVARAFFTEVVQLHGVPQSIISDRDPVFTSAFGRADDASRHQVVHVLCLPPAD
jgi:hypothetical protein